MPLSERPLCMQMGSARMLRSSTCDTDCQRHEVEEAAHQRATSALFWTLQKAAPVFPLSSGRR